MKQLNAVALLAGIALLAACSDSPTSIPSVNNSLSPRFAAGGNSGPSASGGAHFYILGELRTFSFTAVTHKDGTVSGQAQLFNRQQDVRDHIAVNCLRIVGNIAYVSGVITQSSDPAQVGRYAVWSVQDNGEGKAPPDKVSLVFIFPTPVSCNTSSPFPNNPADGNIQVRP